MKKIIVIVGPTAVGKTSFAIDIAQRLNSEIISCDSRQFYKELEIGTAKPSLEELKKVQHYFINSHSIIENYTAFDFEKDALNKIDELHQTSDCVILVGGSGLFVKAVCEGFDEIPDIESEIREKLNSELNSKGLDFLKEELKIADPIYYSEVDLQNSQRVVRALEVFRGTGKPFSTFRTFQAKKRDFEIIKIGLEMDREKLYERIDLRMDLMLSKGLLEEVENLEKCKNNNALQTVGYKEIFEYLEVKYDWEECVRLLKRNSRRYAKRQLTWFKKDEKIIWFNSDSSDLIDKVLSIID